MTNRGAVRSEIQKTQVSFTATFAGLSGYSNDVGEFTRSPEYEFGGHKWYIRIYPGGDEEETKEYLSCFLHCTSTVRAGFSLSILDHLGKQQKPCLVSLNEFRNDGYGLGDFVSLKDLKSPSKGYCVDDTLTILVDIVVYNPMEKYKIADLTNPCSQTIVSDLNNLLGDNTTADITVIVDVSSTSGNASEDDTSTTNTLCQSQTRSNKRKHVSIENAEQNKQIEVRIPAHKLILSMRSPVFRAMFTTGMAEAINNEVRIQDFDAAVVKEFLRFLYTDQCEVAVLEQYSVQLLAIACKYQVPRLETKCESHLIDSLTAANVINIISIAELYNAGNLRIRALHYIALHAKEIVLAGLTIHDLSHELSKQVLRALVGVSQDK